ncbi:phenylpyruvate tautomerase MIF-related protein [Maridesulfovibrio sp.]|jgi:phenylpyruvate tautomerase PptA (4-oxalocrotonate tautomerase family)|uniref:phenylpyruvate tautomerase MIF-related protein n=1 Tax=Maridesulfovibrio sp. TaxID=2795000 RepID=UPI0029CA30F4|nr:phenylpyruvate tautomerase MIF-related protein [Maridesulfovibrio sp.]
MPFIRVETNVDVTGEDFTAGISKLIAGNLGKPESFVMVCVHSGLKMSFGGKFDPCALLTLKSLGLQASQCKELSSALTGFMGEKLGISADRIYIEFADHDREMFGWNGGTFG